MISTTRRTNFASPAGSRSTSPTRSLAISNNCLSRAFGTEFNNATGQRGTFPDPATALRKSSKNPNLAAHGNVAESAKVSLARANR